MRQDDPKRCTAAKLARFGLALRIHRASSLPRYAIVLNPFAGRLLSPADKEEVQDHGLVAVDCSWERVDEVLRGFTENSRRLPALLAANPTKFSQRGVLSSVEALAAALYISGFKNQAKVILSKFKWGPHFLVLNKEPLREYSAVSTEDEISKIEESFF